MVLSDGNSPASRLPPGGYFILATGRVLPIEPVKEWSLAIKVIKLETFIVNVPYKRTEVSSVVFRSGVTSVIVKLTTDQGAVGWGEACSGADAKSIEAALWAMFPFVNNQSPWKSAAVRRDLFHRGLWALRPTTGNYAWVALDMALWDLCGKESKLPVYKLLGGAMQDEIDYFFYLSHGSQEDVEQQCLEGASRGYTTFYLKVGIDLHHELEMVKTIRDTIGAEKKIRLDANGAWLAQDALRNLQLFEPFGIDFIEQPVRESPASLMKELRKRSPIPLAANEGLWTEEDANRLILERVADVYTFSPYWVGGLDKFTQVAYLAQTMGSTVCRHTHGELGIAAAAFHHASLAIPNLARGNQQTAAHIEADILVEAIPTTFGPTWGIPDGVGLGIEVDLHALEKSNDLYKLEGQYLPYGTI